MPSEAPSTCSMIRPPAADAPPKTPVPGAPSPSEIPPDSEAFPLNTGMQACNAYTIGQ